MLVIFLFVAVFFQLTSVTIVRSGKLQAKALEQWYRDLPITAERGEILDVNGVVIADSVTTYTIYVRPIDCSNKMETAKILAEYLELKYERVLEKLNSRSSEVVVKKGVDKSTVLKIVGSVASGVYVSQAIKRVYPYGDFLTQVMGFTNVDASGQTGIEKYYDSYLKGIDGYAYTPSDLVGRKLKKGVTYYKEGSKGGVLRLSIDKNVQDSVENAVENCAFNTSAKTVSAIVMDCDTGAIRGIATTPSFDLNEVPRDNVAELMRLSRINLISDVFEPGSTFKMVTAALGIDSGKITTNYRSYCGGSMTVDGQKIKCWKTIGHGSQSFTEGVASSCNCLFMNIALTLGVDYFYDGIEAFGLMEKTGIDIGGESSGLSIKRESVKPVDLARIGFGQAVAVTPIELLTACNAVVNGGKLVTPYIAESVTDYAGNTTKLAENQVKRRVIKEETSAIMRTTLEQVVLVGSGKSASVEGIRVGGKTGTAQKYENGAIARGKYVSTFVGFAPVENPKYIALIVVDEPIGAYYGGLVAAPYVGQIFKSIF
ncbi:MAG: stage V sporulation protein D [Clostridia bacterium]|nr:stage V sporulation protein D [Clostridia bacterium]